MDRDEILCNCFSVTAGDIEDAFNEGLKTYEEIQEKTSCGAGCGVCEQSIREFIDNLK